VYLIEHERNCEAISAYYMFEQIQGFCSKN